MIDSVFSILGLDYSSLQIPDTALLVVCTIVFLFILDWIFRLLSMMVGTLTKKGNNNAL